MMVAQRDELADDEGRRGKVYDDATGRLIVPGSHVIGHPSIGVGRALDVHGLDDTEIDFLFTADVYATERELGKLVWWQRLTPVRQGVIVNMAFNMGVGGLLGFRHMIAAIERGDYEAAALEMLRSRWAQQVQASRRDRLIAQMRSGVVA